MTPLPLFLMVLVVLANKGSALDCRQKAAHRLCAVNFPDVGHDDCLKALETKDCYILLCLKDFVKCNIHAKTG